MLKNLDITHPGAFDEAGMITSVRRNSIDVGQAIDLPGEQTYMKNAKTTGGINNFAGKPETVAKWVLGRPFQTRFLEALFDICGRPRTMTNPRKCLRSSEIKRSNTMVEKVINVITTQFLNPFDDDLEKEQLFSLVSGVPVGETITEILTSIKQNGKHAMCNFVERWTGIFGCNKEIEFEKLSRRNYESKNIQKWKRT